MTDTVDVLDADDDPVCVTVAVDVLLFRVDVDGAPDIVF